ncbi:MAG: hypothetical protein ACKOCN_08505 [Planctomycetaceae bacterium]
MRPITKPSKRSPPTRRGPAFRASRLGPRTGGRRLAAERLEQRLPLAIDIVQTTGEEYFFIDTEQGRKLTSEYAGYAITNGNGQTYDNVWVRAYDFNGGVVRLGSQEDGYYFLGRLDPCETDHVWFYLSALTGTAVDQSHTITVYDGDPREGGLPITGATQSFTIDLVQQTIEASSTKIFTIQSGPTAQTRTDELLFHSLLQTSSNPFTAVST